MLTNAEYVEIAKIQDELLQQWYPYTQFGKRCFTYCEDRCNCDASISLEVKMQAHALAREEFKKRKES